MAVKACSRCWIVVRDEHTDNCPQCGKKLLRVSEESLPEKRVTR
jgi:RNA polymerase subunit RPABC4/transcription elongation factor Spt4